MTLRGYDSWKTTEPLDWYDVEDSPDPDDFDLAEGDTGEEEAGRITRCVCSRCGVAALLVGDLCVKCDHLTGDTES